MTNEEISKEISNRAAEMEKALGAVLNAFAEREAAAGTSPVVLIGSIHMVLCCLLSKVFLMASNHTKPDINPEDIRKHFLNSVHDGVEHFMSTAERMEPQILVEALLKSLGQKWEQ